jgi:hypothetical protein
MVRRPVCVVNGIICKIYRLTDTVFWVHTCAHKLRCEKNYGHLIYRQIGWYPFTVYAVCESDAMGESIIGHVPSVDNPADICTKVVPGGQKRNHLIRLLLHDWCD